MIGEQTLREVVGRVVAESNQSRVILFGSYGRGDADEGSDLDIMVIKPQVGNRGEEMVRLCRAIGDVGVGVDVLVYSDAEYIRRSQVPGTALYWARREGRTLYDAAS